MRIGYIALTDCAPFMVAQEWGLFKKYGLQVELKRELGWATIRDKLLYRELDAVHALGGMALAATLGIGSPAIPCCTGLMLNVLGNGITLSRKMTDNGVTSAVALKSYIEQHAPARLLFAVVFPTASHHFLLRSWLRQGGIDPRQVDIVVLPPPQVFRNLEAGTIHGYCVGEPWNSMATEAGVGACVATSRDIAPNHPEKVLMVREDFATGRAEENETLLRAMNEALDICVNPEHRARIVKFLASATYLNCPERIVEKCLLGGFRAYRSGAMETVPPEDLMLFDRPFRVPTIDNGRWFLAGLKEAGLLNGMTPDARVLQSVYRQDLYEKLF